jgi:hypothetical protein
VDIGVDAQCYFCDDRIFLFHDRSIIDYGGTPNHRGGTFDLRRSNEIFINLRQSILT